MARWTLKRALDELGIPHDCEVKTPQGYDIAMAAWKRLTIDARRSNNDDRAAMLSLCKTIIQKKRDRHTSKVCPTCGKAKSSVANQCQMCSHTSRYYAHSLEKGNLIMHEIEKTPILIPEINKRQSEVSLALKQLVNGQIGDSFVTNKPISTTSLMAKMLGGTIICRSANPEEKDSKKRKFRVWRSDGLSMSEVNAIIQRRIDGEILPRPAPWKVPEQKELLRIKGRSKEKRQETKPPGAVTAETSATSGDEEEHSRVSAAQ